MLFCIRVANAFVGIFVYHLAVVEGNCTVNWMWVITSGKLWHCVISCECSGAHAKMSEVLISWLIRTRVTAAQRRIKENISCCYTARKRARRAADKRNKREINRGIPICISQKNLARKQNQNKNRKNLKLQDKIA